MIDRTHDLPITQQACALGISRGSVYYLPRPVSPADLAIMRRMDELHLEFPFASSRMLRDLVNREGITVGRRHVATLMKRMGVEAIYRKPNTSRPAPRHKVYPYLLRRVRIDRLTPFEFICKCWTSEPERSRLNPIHQMPGSNSRGVSAFQ